MRAIVLDHLASPADAGFSVSKNRGQAPSFRALGSPGHLVVCVRGWFIHPGCGELVAQGRLTVCPTMPHQLSPSQPWSENE